jgi:hypothetical protein
MPEIVMVYAVFFLAGFAVGAFLCRLFLGRKIESLTTQHAELKDRFRGLLSNYYDMQVTEGSEETGEDRSQGDIRDRVRVTKMDGRPIMGLPVSFVGYEEYPPEVGRPYSVFADEGVHFRSSAVTEIGDNVIRTQGSEYRIELLDEREGME